MGKNYLTKDPRHRYLSFDKTIKDNQVFTKKDGIYYLEEDKLDLVKYFQEGESIKIIAGGIFPLAKFNYQKRRIR